MCTNIGNVIGNTRRHSKNECEDVVLRSGEKIGNDECVKAIDLNILVP